MPNIKSAKKRVKVINTKTMRNKAVKSALKTTLKKADAATAVKAPESEAAVRAAIKAVDQACAKGLMHKNCAARKKSQLAKKLNAAKAEEFNAELIIRNYYISQMLIKTNQGATPKWICTFYF